MLKHYLLILSALCSFLVALLHVYVIAKGAQAYRFFGAGETLASMAERGSWIPGSLTAVITLVFVVFGLYYIAAAGWQLWSLPMLKTGLVVIAAIYTLRGAAVLPALLFRMNISAFDLWSSWISLAIGVLHCLATWLYIRDGVSS